MKRTNGIKTTDYYRYADKVIKGKIRACLYVRQACERFMKDLQRKDLEFRVGAVNKGFRFINALKHFAGKSSGKPFLLEPFQSFIVANLLGWYWVKTGDRRFTSAYIEMARKGGKTALIAALAIYFFLGDGEDAAEVDIAANDFEQAKVCFRFIQQYSRVDSIDRPVPYAVTEYVEVNRLRWWQQVLMWIGGVGLLLTGIFTALRLRK